MSIWIGFIKDSSELPSAVKNILFEYPRAREMDRITVELLTEIILSFVLEGPRLTAVGLRFLLFQIFWSFSDDHNSRKVLPPRHVYGSVWEMWSNISWFAVSIFYSHLDYVNCLFFFLQYDYKKNTLHLCCCFNIRLLIVFKFDTDIINSFLKIAKFCLNNINFI